MTENEKARELIATSETTVKVDPQNGWYLKRFAALQFEGSVDNFGTNMPIHVLEQQLPKEDTMKLDDAVIEGQEIDYSRFYDEKGNEYSSVSELVQTRLGLDDDDAIQEYNKENPGLPYIPYEKLRDMDKKDIPEMLSSVVDEADYVDAYKEVTHEDQGCYNAAYCYGYAAGASDALSSLKQPDPKELYIILSYYSNEDDGEFDRVGSCDKVYPTLEAAKAAADKLFKEDKENRPENLAVAYTLDDCIRDIEENPLYVVGEWQKNAFGSYHNFYAVFSVSLAEN